MIAAIAWLAVSPAARGSSIEDGPVRILAPRSGALVTTGVLRARVRVGGAIAGFHAELHGTRTRNVTGRFQAAGAGVRAATLRLGHELAPGSNHLYVTVDLRGGGRRVVSSHFLVGRARTGLLTLRGVRDGVHSPISARVRVAAGATLRARLNGRGVRRELEPSAGGWLTASLAADDGLRFGRNRLTLTALTRSGRYQRLRRSFTVRRDRPLVGAGRDRTIVAGARARLDGRSTRAGRRADRLRLRWRIVARPQGSSRARLRGAHGARPRLLTDVPGRYKVRLAARELRKHRRHRGRAPAFAGALSAAATDTVTLTAQPDALPQGVPVETIVSASKPGVQVGSSFYPAWSGGWVEAVVLDRATLSEISVNTYTGDQPGMNGLALDVAKLSSDDLVILSGMGRFAGLSASAQRLLARALGGLGASLPFGTAGFVHGNWSLIGVPGTPPGSAHVCDLTYCWVDPGALPGEISGWLQVDLKGNFAFAWPATYNGFDTRAPGSTSTRNVMQISFGPNPPATYASAQMSGPAFQLLWLDSGTLAVRGNYTYSTSTGPGCGGSGCLQGLAAKLDQIANDPTPGLVMLSSFGKPNVGGPAKLSWWGWIATLLQGMGANPWVVLGLDGSGDYTLVGVEGLSTLHGPNAGAELSQVETGRTARLAGLFERNRQGLWKAGANGNPDPVNPPSTFQPDLTKILAQPDDPYPFPQTAAQRAAERWIARPQQQGGLGLPIDPRFGIRASYWRNLSIDWDSKRATLESMAPCGADDCPAGFRLATFDAVRDELVTELGMIDQLRDFFTGGGPATLSGELSSTFDEGAYDFTATAQHIRDLYTPPAVSPQGTNVGGIMDGILTIASGAGGAIPEVGGLIAAPFTIARGALMITQALTNNADGSSALDPSTFDTDVYGWGAQLEDAADDAVDSLGLVFQQLVSDRGRLDAAAAKIDDYQPGTANGWGFDPQSEAALQQALTRSMGRYLWSTMLPVVSQLAVCSNSEPSGVPAPGLAHVNRVIADAEGSGFQGVSLYAVTPYLRPLDEGVYETLFSPDLTAGNVNLDPRYFYALANSAGGDAFNSPTPTSPGFLQLTRDEYFGVYNGACGWPGTTDQ